MPWASAACITVCSRSAWIDCPSMKISAGIPGSVAERAPVLDQVLELVAKLVEDADRRVAGGIAHPADRVAVVQARDLIHAVDVLGPSFARDDAVDDPVQPAHPFAAGRALAARLVVVEAQHHLQQPHHARAVGDDDHAARAKRRTGRFHLLVIEMQRRDLLGRQHLGGNAPGNDGLESAPAGNAAAVLVDELGTTGNRPRFRTRPAG